MCLCADATEVAATSDHSADSPLHLAAAESATADCSWGLPPPKYSNIKSCLNVSLNLIFKSTMQMGIEKIYHGNTRCLKFLEVLIKHDYLLLKSNIYS
ncbi:Chromosome segregation ATPase [Giardia duodenalis]|uniref:Chromosome segregation ATPase n=1 Tax=Giardia intestinalis TaxID=5741 RepID=V6TTA5_GIAIN|nr:Chromosome segregation ATPase [Giardia intestinalis]